MAVSIDDDTLAAVRDLWLASNLPALVSSPPQAGTLKAPQPQVYVQLESKLDRRECVSTKGAWFDYRRVAIKVRGPKDQVIPVASAARGVFTRTCVLSLPSGDRFIRFWPDESDKLEEEKSIKWGKDVWRAELGGVVWTVRLD